MNTKLHAKLRRIVILTAALAMADLLAPAHTQAQTNFYLSCCVSNGCISAARAATIPQQTNSPLVETNGVSFESDSSSYKTTSTFGALQLSAACASSSASSYANTAAFQSDLTNAPVVGFVDTLTINSPLLPAGTPVQIQVTCLNTDVLSLSISGNASLVNIAQCGGSNTLSIADTNGNIVASRSIPLGQFANGSSGVSTVTNSVAILVTQFSVRVSFEIACGFVDEGTILFYPGLSASASIMDNYNSVTYVNVLTPGANYTAASGTIYPALNLWPPLALEIAPTNSQGVVISWPGVYTNYALQQNADLGTTNWVGNGDPTNLINGTNQVAISPATGTMFYRLASP